MKERHILEELKNIHLNQPLCNGDTISRHTAMACVNRGWARKTKSGHYEITGKGAVVNRFIQSFKEIYKELRC